MNGITKNIRMVQSLKSIYDSRIAPPSNVENLHPSVAAAWGKTYLLRDQPLTALPYLQRAATRQPKRYTDTLLLGLVYFHLEDDANAYKVWAGIEKTFTRFLTSQASQSIRSDDRQTATRYYLIALRLDPTNPIIYQRLGENYRQLGERNLAADAYQKAAQFTEMPFDKTLYLGNAYSLLGEWSSAIDAYQYAITLNPKEAKPYLQLGEALLTSRIDISLAVKNLEKAALLEPGVAKTYIYLLQASEDLQDWDLGEKWLLEAIKNLPDNPTIIVQGIQFYLVADRPRDALKLSNQLILINPTAEAWQIQGDIYTQLQDGEQAQKAYQEAVTLKPSAENQLRLVQAYLDNNKPCKALRIIENLNSETLNQSHLITQIQIILDKSMKLCESKK